VAICRRKVKALCFFLSDDFVVALIGIDKKFIFIYIAIPVSAVPDEVDLITFAESA